MNKTFKGKDLDIGKAILEWLNINNLSKTVSSFTEETSIQITDATKTKALDKKWNTIILLQKKISDLELQVKTLKEDIEKAAVSGISGISNTKKDNTSMGLPRQPEKSTLKGHRSPITSLLFHPVFSLLVSASEDATIGVWECSDQFTQEQSVRGHTNSINNIAFDGVGKLLASCSSDLTIKIWKFDNPLKTLKTLNGHEHAVSSVEFTPDGNFLYSCSRDKTIKHWEIATGYCKRTFKGHDEWVRSLSLNSESSLLASCSDDETIIIWDTNSSAEKYKLQKHDNKIDVVLFIKNDIAKLNIYQSDYANSTNTSNIIDNNNNNEDDKNKLINLNKKIMEKSNTPTKINKEYLLSCSRDKTIILWDVMASNVLYTFEGHDNWVRSIITHPSGKYIVSSSDDRCIRIWDLSSGRCVRKMDKVHEKFICALAANNKFPMIASGSNDLCIKIWDCK